MGFLPNVQVGLVHMVIQSGTDKGLAKKACIVSVPRTESVPFIE